MNDRIIMTKSSVWFFDQDLKEFRRTPREEGAGHPVTPYVEGWHPYIEIEEHLVDDDKVRFVVVTPNVMTSLTSTYRISEQRKVST